MKTPAFNSIMLNLLSLVVSLLLFGCSQFPKPVLPPQWISPEYPVPVAGIHSKYESEAHTTMEAFRANLTAQKQCCGNDSLCLINLQRKATIAWDKAISKYDTIRANVAISDKQNALDQMQKISESVTVCCHVAQ